jgi:hypothetical protein
MALSQRELSSTPSMKVLYPKALVGAGRAALGRLPLLGGGEARLPEVELRLRDVEVERGRLAHYNRVCGFRLRDELPPTFPHLLAFPLSMQIMTGGSFPFPVVGMVHIRNRITQDRPIRVDEPLDVRVRCEDLRPHDKGTQFDVVAEVEALGEPVWRSWSTYLHRGGGGGSSGRNGGESRSDTPRPSAIWEVPGDIGRRYASVSGDANPIHLHSLSSRLLGMGRPIAHGMWLKARCLAALEGVLPGACAIDVRFKVPLPIPGKVGFSSWAEGEGRGFAVHDRKGEKPHLTGEAGPA